MGQVYVDDVTKFGAKFGNNETWDGRTLLNETIKFDSTMFDKINAVHSLITPLREFDTNGTVEFAPRQCTPTVGFHDLGHFEKLRHGRAQCRCQTQRTDDNLEDALIFDGKTGHSKIGGACQSTNQNHRQSQSLVPLAVVMHAMCMEPFIAKGIVRPFDQEFFLRIGPGQRNCGRRDGTGIRARLGHLVC